jgi:hypothetical protein
MVVNIQFSRQSKAHEDLNNATKTILTLEWMPGHAHSGILPGASTIQALVGTLGFVMPRLLQSTGIRYLGLVQARLCYQGEFFRPCLGRRCSQHSSSRCSTIIFPVLHRHSSSSISHKLHLLLEVSPLIRPLMYCLLLSPIPVPLAISQFWSIQ